MEGNFGGGVFVSDAARDTLVERNRVDNNYGLPAFQSDGDRTLIQRNTTVSTAFAGSSNFGITVGEHAEDNRVELNTLDRVGGLDIDDSGTRSVITGNVMVGQIFPAPLITGAIGGIVVREAASQGRIQANVVRRHSPVSDFGAGILIAGDGFTVAGNLVSEVDTQDGIRVEPEAAGALLQANVGSKNGDDGIDVDSPATTVTANVANGNADLGIETVEGVTDGGGNRAHGNGNPAQCVGVRCS